MLSFIHLPLSLFQWNTVSTLDFIWIKDLSDPFMVRQFEAFQFPLVTKASQQWNLLGNEWSAEGVGVYYITEDYKGHHKSCCQWKEGCINVSPGQNQAATGHDPNFSPFYPLHCIYCVICVM